MFLQIKYNYNYMNDCINILFLCFLFLFVYSSCKEGYINKPIKDEPDDIQFYACHDKTKLDYRGIQSDTMANNNYKLKKHGIGLPLKGVYSSFLDIYKIRDYDEIYHSPICEDKYSFKGITNLNPPEIIDHENILDEEQLLKEEDEYENNSIKDPHYKYVHPDYIGNKITYSDDVNELFITVHKSHDEENLLHRLDSKYRVE